MFNETFPTIKRLKLLGLLVLSTFVISATLMRCEKDDLNPDNPAVTEQEVQFGVKQINTGNLKSNGDPDLPECSDATPVSAYIKLSDGENEYEFTPSVFKIDDKWYTEVFKVNLGEEDSKTFSVLEFKIYDYNGTLIKATPTEGSLFADFVTMPTGQGFTITVNAFEKLEIPIEVICYQDEAFKKFGFYWFNIEDVVAHEINFFGDICLKYFMDYHDLDDPTEGYGYADLAEGLMDMPAIFKVEVYEGTPVDPGDFLISFDNEYMLDDGIIEGPLGVYYPDHLNLEDDMYTFKLYVRVKVGDDFTYQLFEIFKINADDGILKFSSGEVVPDYASDMIVDFVLGNCAYYEEEDDPMRPDIEFPPYMNLPETANMDISHPYDTLSYWKVVVNSVSPAGTYDFETGTYAGWCGDANSPISEGNANYTVCSSLYPVCWPCDVITTGEINKINQLYNYIKISSSTYHWKTIQNAIWLIRGQKSTDPYYPDYDEAAVALLDEVGELDPGYMPLPGGWAAVLFFKDCESQLIFIQVDP